MAITIIIATRNAGAHLQNCFDSILEQSLPPKQVIVQDALSSDGTVSILKEYEKKFCGTLVWRSERDMGIADAWNKALGRADGEWILFMGADDRLFNSLSLLEASRLLHDAHPPHSIVYGDLAIVDPEGSPISILAEPWKDIKSDFLLSRECLRHQAIFHHQSIFSPSEPFRTDLRICADQELLRRTLDKSEALYLPGLRTTKMAIGGISSQRRYILTLNRELLLIQQAYRRVPLWDPLYWRLLKASLIYLATFILSASQVLGIINLYRTLLARKPPLAY